MEEKIEIKLIEGERVLFTTDGQLPAELEESITEVAKSTRRRRGVESKIEYIWHRIKMGQTLNSIAKRNGIEDWKVLYEHNRDLLRNPNILNYIDEDIYDIGWCINNKQGIVRIPILNSQDQEEENTVCEGCGKTITSRFMQSYTKGAGLEEDRKVELSMDEIAQKFGVAVKDLKIKKD